MAAHFSFRFMSVCIILMFEFVLGDKGEALRELKCFKHPIPSVDFQGDLLLHLCSCVGGFIYESCYAIVCSLFLLFCSFGSICLSLLHFLSIFDYIVKK